MNIFIILMIEVLLCQPYDGFTLITTRGESPIGDNEEEIKTTHLIDNEHHIFPETKFDFGQVVTSLGIISHILEFWHELEFPVHAELPAVITTDESFRITCFLADDIAPVGTDI